ncbi:MAG: hypothetical protein AAFQ08_02715, partial [Bacteroidota bacterium]
VFAAHRNGNGSCVLLDTSFGSLVVRSLDYVFFLIKLLDFCHGGMVTSAGFGKLENGPTREQS